MADGTELIMSEEIQDQIDEINQKLDRVAEILLGLRVAFGDMPLPDTEDQPAD